MFSQVSVCPQDVCISGSMSFLGMGIYSTRSLPAGLCRWLSMSGGGGGVRGEYAHRGGMSRELICLGACGYVWR